jgi:hypothetical protein
MQCFLHRDAAAVGICKTCGKGVCPACAREVDRGLVCSDPCADYASTNLEIVGRAKRVYSIGENRPKIPMGALFFGIFGLLFMCFAALEWWGDSPLWPVVTVTGSFGVVFVAFSVIFWRRYRTLGLSL